MSPTSCNQAMLYLQNFKVPAVPVLLLLTSSPLLPHQALGNKSFCNQTAAKDLTHRHFISEVSPSKIR